MRHETAGEVARQLEGRGCAVVTLGAVRGEETPWPDVAEQVGRLVAQGAFDLGVLCCWTGTGVCMAANKVPGVRAALCGDPETARGARRWNDANVLALSLARLEAADIAPLLDAWLGEDRVDPEERRNIDRLAELERRYREGGVAR